MANKRRWQQRIDNTILSDIVPDRLQQLIDVMERVADQARAFDMHCWQRRNHDAQYAKTESELDECGMPACMGGWLAASPEFQAAGGNVDWQGAPVLGVYEKSYAIQKFLIGDKDVAFCNANVFPQLATLLAHPEYHLYDDDNPIHIGAVLEKLRYAQKLNKKIVAICN